VSANPRHADVGQNNIGVMGPCDTNTLASIVGDRDSESFIGEQIVQHLITQFFVVDDKNGGHSDQG
jgi:hypothetical protein